jgi:murein DD-endopeptidase MepM/ murein hydrolase activator NlpD
MLKLPFNNPRTYAGHSGVDFPQPRGTIVRASGRGVVSFRSFNARAGNMFWIDYYDGGTKVGTAYAHLDNYDLVPPKGTVVNEGDPICRVGNSGRSTGPHLHMEIAGWATTAGFWKFYGNAVVGASKPASTPVVVKPQPAPVPDPITESSSMIALIIKHGHMRHLATLDVGVFRHLIQTDNPERVKNIIRERDDWQEIDLSELGIYLRTYGCDLNIWDIRDANGKSTNTPGDAFVVLDPLTGQARQGGVWTATNARYADLRKLITEKPAG